jgi:enamine deaminase RidA (YjgF/YER057c/UK114 family)
MKYKYFEWDDLSVHAGLSCFSPSGGIAEFHAVIQLNNTYCDAETQYENIEKAIVRLRQFEELSDAVLVLKRYFMSDAANQSAFLGKNEDGAAVSIVQQPPLNGAKVSVWVYFVADSKIYVDGLGSTVLIRPHFKHLYHTQMQKALKDEYLETEYIFNIYMESLYLHGCTLKDNCIRTWIYVQNVDVHYIEMVKARISCFNKEGLNRETHYIASTGIEGKHTDPKSLVLMDAYAIEGVSQEQIKYLYAPTHLNPTYEYGVTFERGVSVDYGDRRHIFISGTASINNQGEIVHLMDVKKQAERTLENIRVLLSEAGAGLDDMAQMIVYLRDTADYKVVSDYLNKQFPHLPKVIVWAPVCRLGWLIEIECIAIKELETNLFEKF